MKIFRWLLIGVLSILLIGTMGLIGWATLSAQEATERAVSVLQDNSVQREDGQLVFRSSSPTAKGLIYYPADWLIQKHMQLPDKASPTQDIWS